MMVPYEDSEDIVQVQWAQLRFGIVLLLISESGQLQVYEDGGQKLLHIYQLEKGVGAGPGLAGNGVDRIFVGTGHGPILSLQVQRHQLSTGPLLTCYTHQSAISHLQTHHNFLASGDVQGNIVVWDLTNNQLLASFGPFQSAVVSLVMHDDLVVAGFLTGHMRVICYRKDVVFEIAGHSRAITAVDIDPRTNTIVCASEDSFITVYSFPNADNQLKVLASAVPFPGLLTGICCSGPPSIILTSAYDSNEIHMMKLIT